MKLHDFTPTTQMCVNPTVMCVNPTAALCSVLSTGRESERFAMTDSWYKVCVEFLMWYDDDCKYARENNVRKFVVWEAIIRRGCEDNVATLRSNFASEINVKIKIAVEEF